MPRKTQTKHVPDDTTSETTEDGSRMSVRGPVAKPAPEHPLLADARRLSEGTVGDPHGVLGLHKVDGALEARVWRPGAATVTVLVGGDEHPLARVGDTALFAGVVPEAALDGYRLRGDDGHGNTWEWTDPYRFWPTLGEVDLHLIGEGRHREMWRVMGAHPREHDGVVGTSFSVWAPAARSVRVVGDWNGWDGRMHPMRALGSSGVWELFLPDVGPGSLYKFEILTQAGDLTLKADPFAFAAEVPPGTASIVCRSSYQWTDDEWMQAREEVPHHERPMSIYELHLASWRQKPEDGNRPLTYRELAEELPEYLADLGFTHVEFLPVAEHPFGGSWGYQVSSYFAPTSRFGTPDDFRFLVDALHRRGIGVIVDWVPAHFPKDAWALARFDGTALYEHEDPRQGEHPDWGTLVFNFGRHEVRGFLIANALYWLEELHIDGLRVDAVASMLYLDYSRKDGEWVPNQFGGRENLEAVGFLREMNEVVYERHPGAMTIAEESTAWPSVSRPTWLGGLGFGFKWNMGWMHDTLEYFSKDPVHRRYHHNDLTFGLLYAFSESFVLPLSHDEVVHGKGSLVGKMPGDWWQQLANLRALYAWMWAHPGKQLLFMGAELAQGREWNHDTSLDWHLLEHDSHRGVQDLVRSLNRIYQQEPALWEQDAVPEGFQWIDASDVDGNVLSFLRWSKDRSSVVACVANLSPVPRQDYRVGLPKAGWWTELLNTDAAEFGGSGTGNGGGVDAVEETWHGQPASAQVTLPPLGVVWLKPA